MDQNDFSEQRTVDSGLFSQFTLGSAHIPMNYKPQKVKILCRSQKCFMSYVLPTVGMSLCPQTEEPLIDVLNHFVNLPTCNGQSWKMGFGLCAEIADCGMQLWEFIWNIWLDAWPTERGYEKT